MIASVHCIVQNAHRCYSSCDRPGPWLKRNVLSRKHEGRQCFTQHVKPQALRIFLMCRCAMFPSSTPHALKHANYPHSTPGVIEKLAISCKGAGPSYSPGGARFVRCLGGLPERNLFAKTSSLGGSQVDIFGLRPCS